MRDNECVELLQWMLPVLRLRWGGFRRVRKQVCKRLARRLKELGLESAADYRRYLHTDEAEWAVADSLCRVTISRFCRDQGVFAFLGARVLPAIGTRALEDERDKLLAWSAGCGSGEEPFTLSLVWEFESSGRLPGMDLEILASDADERLLRRAREANYPGGCLRDLPHAWRAAAFEFSSGGYRLRSRYRDRVRFELHDVRHEPPGGPYDLVLCRNLAFTYFDDGLQRATADRLAGSLRAGGALVLGSHEALPAAVRGYAAWSKKNRVYRRLAD